MTRGKQFHLVAMGGGNGTGRVLLGARPFFDRLTAIVAVTDTGRSTGVARRLAGMPAPGDLRNTLATLTSEPQSLMVRLLQHRFQSDEVPDLNGMAVGNLLIAALTRMTGDFAQAITLLAEQVDLLGDVLPISTVSTDICAELVDGSIMLHELAVRRPNKPRIRRLFLADPQAPAHPPALEAIRQADVVVIGPGSFYTSLLATLLFAGVIDALRETAATVVFVSNTTTQTGPTDGYRAIDHIQAMVDVLGPGVLDVALINRSEHVNPALLEQYAAEGIYLLHPDEEEVEQIAALGVRPLVRDFVEETGQKRELWNKQDTLRHDLEVLEMALWKIALDRSGLT